jgi:hypothetical protein
MTERISMAESQNPTASDFNGLVKQMGDLTAAIGGIVIANEKSKKVKYHELRRDSSFYNFEKDGPRAKLKRQFYQNGGRVNPNVLRNEEIEIINNLTPGKYNNGKWEVRIVRDSVDLRYKNKKVGDRIGLSSDAARHGGGLAGMLRLIALEQESATEDRAAPRRRA